jgi:hypothetical protein
VRGATSGGIAGSLGETGQMVFQAVQIALALGIVAAFAALQFDLTRPDSRGYLLTNLVCAAGLTLIAVLAFQLGFVISNGLWAGFSALGLIRLARKKPGRGDREAA